jgi:hypothetical protein
MTAADLYQEMTQVAQLVDLLRQRVEQLDADVRAAAARLQAMPPMATDIRISPPDYVDWTNVAASLEQLENEIAEGGCVIIEIGKVQPRACYWLNSVDVKKDTVTVRAKRIGSGVNEKVAIISKARFNITGRYLLARLGA